MTKKTTPKPRGVRFFIEMIVATVLSIVSAGLWADFIRAIVSKYFQNDIRAVFVFAFATTIIAILSLRYFFADVPQDEEGYLPEREYME